MLTSAPPIRPMSYLQGHKAMQPWFAGRQQSVVASERAARLGTHPYRKPPSAANSATLINIATQPTRASAHRTAVSGRGARLRAQRAAVPCAPAGLPAPAQDSLVACEKKKTHAPRSK
jgi:hypothetical protein